MNKFIFLAVVLILFLGAVTRGFSQINEDWKKEMSGIFEGTLNFYFMDGGDTDLGRIYIDIYSPNPSVAFDGVLIPDYDLNHYRILNKTWNISGLIDITYDKNLDILKISFEDDFLMNNGNDFVYTLKRVGDYNQAKEELLKIKEDDKLFSVYWENFLTSVRTKDYTFITDNATYPLIDFCTKETINNRDELINKLRYMFGDREIDENDNKSENLRIVDHYAKIFGGKYYFQKNISIFLDIIDGEVKIMNFHCGFG